MLQQTNKIKSETIFVRKDVFHLKMNLFKQLGFKVSKVSSWTLAAGKTDARPAMVKLLPYGMEVDAKGSKVENHHMSPCSAKFA